MVYPAGKCRTPIIDKFVMVSLLSDIHVARFAFFKTKLGV